MSENDAKLSKNAASSGLGGATCRYTNNVAGFRFLCQIELYVAHIVGQVVFLVL